MGKEIDAARLKVTVTATSAPMKKEMEKAKQIARSATESVSRIFGRIKNPLESLSGNGALASVRKFQDKLKSMTKKFQLDAGIKVHTDEFLDLENDISKVENTLKKLRREEEALRDLGADRDLSDKYRKAKTSAEEAAIALNKLLEKKEELEDSGRDMEFTPAFQKLSDSYDARETELFALKKEREARKAKNIGMRDIKEDGTLINLQEEIKKAEEELERLSQEMRSLEDKGESVQITKEMGKLGEQIDAARNKLGKYKTEMTELTAAGMENGTEEWIKNQKAIEKATNEMRKYEQEKRNLEASGNDAKRLYSAPKEIFKGIAVGIPKLGLSGIQKGWGGITKIFGGMRSVLSSVTSAIKKTSGVFGALIQKFKTSIPFINKTKSSFNGLEASGHGLSGILKTVGMTAKFMFASFVIRGALDGTKEGFKNLAQYSNKTNSSISLLMSSLTQLKNALAAAFAPILNVVAPILNSFIQKIISVVNAFGQLTSALTGGSTYIKAKKVNQDYPP